MIFESKIVFSVDELAVYLRVSKSTVYRLVHEGAIRGCKVGRDWSFDHAEIDSWIEKREADFFDGTAVMSEHRKGRRAGRFK